MCGFGLETDLLHSHCWSNLAVQVATVLQHKTRAEEIGKCLDEGLEPTYHFSIFHYRKLKSQMRDQTKKSRQLIVAVKNKLQEEETEKMKV